MDRMIRGLGMHVAAVAAVLNLCGAAAAPLALDDLGGARWEPVPLAVPETHATLPAKAAADLAASAEALRSGNFERARGLARRVTDRVPEAAEGWHVLGLAEANLGRMEEALDALDAAAERYSRNAEPLVARGEILASLGRNEAARAAFEAAVARDPSNWAAAEGYGVLLEAAGDLDGAIAQYRAAAGAAPSDRLFPRFALAQLLARQGRPGDAVGVAQSFADANPERAEAWTFLGRAQMAADRPLAAAEAFAKAADLAPEDPAVLISLAEAEQAGGRPDQAREAISAALELDPAAPAALVVRGRLSEAAGEIDAALADYRAAVASGDAGDGRLDLARLLLATGAAGEAEAALAPLAKREDAADGVLEFLAEARLAAGDTQGARAALERLAARGTTPTGALGLARLEVARADFAAAEETLEAARRAFPDEALVLLELGNLHGAQRDYGKALAYYREGLEMQPASAPFLKGASLAAYRLGDLDAALGDARRLAERPEATGGDHVWLATLLEEAGETDAAIAAYDQGLTLDPANWIALNNLANLVAERDPQRAVDLAERAADIAEGVAAVRDTLGWAYFSAGEMARAEAVFSALTEAEPDNALASYRLGRVYMATGREEEGRRLMRRALDLDPDFAHAGTAEDLVAGP